MPNHEKDHIQIDELKICYTAETDNLNEFFNISSGDMVKACDKATAKGLCVSDPMP